jgi:hypothetical protein
MQVGDALPGVGALVYHQAISPFGQTQLLGDVPRGQHQLAKYENIVGGRVVCACEVLLGDDECVNGRDGMDVFECNDVVVLEHDLRGGGSRDDIAE